MHPAVLPLSSTHRSGCLTTVRPLAISCASRECMGGGAAPYLRASPVPSRASRRGMVKRPCVLMELEKRGGGGGRQGRPWRGGLVTKIVDRRQQAVMRAGMAGQVSPGEHAPSSGEGLGAPRRQKASHGDQRQRADAMSRASPPNTVFYSRTIAPAPPHCRGGTDSHFSGSCHRWDGRCSQR
jgi:hypothetical protein